MHHCAPLCTSLHAKTIAAVAVLALKLGESSAQRGEGLWLSGCASSGGSRKVSKGQIMKFVDVGWDKSGLGRGLSEAEAICYIAVILKFSYIKNQDLNGGVAGDTMTVSWVQTTAD